MENYLLLKFIYDFKCLILYLVKFSIRFFHLKFILNRLFSYIVHLYLIFSSLDNLIFYKIDEFISRFLILLLFSFMIFYRFILVKKFNSNDNNYLLFYLNNHGFILNFLYYIFINRIIDNSLMFFSIFIHILIFMLIIFVDLFIYIIKLNYSFNNYIFIYLLSSFINYKEDEAIFLHNDLFLYLKNISFIYFLRQIFYSIDIMFSYIFMRSVRDITIVLWFIWLSIYKIYLIICDPVDRFFYKVFLYDIYFTLFHKDYELLINILKFIIKSINVFRSYLKFLFF